MYEVHMCYYLAEFLLELRIFRQILERIRQAYYV